MISICIPCSNDQEELDMSIKSILDTATEPYEIIVCDDGSRVPVKNKNAKIIRTKNQTGVGFSIDLAVKHSSGDKVIITGSDIVHRDDRWMNVFSQKLEEEPKTIFVSGTVGYDPDNKTFNKRIRYGSKFILKATRNDIPIARRYAFPENWQMLFRSKWYSSKDLFFLKERNYEVPSILGACYGINKYWYTKLKGFAGHRYWGSLDSYIAAKSWLAGGKCKIAPEITSGHIYSRNNAPKPQDWFLMNKINIARMVYPDIEEELLDHIKDQPGYEFALNMANGYPMYLEIEALREYYKKIFIHDSEWFIKKFNLK